MCSRTQPIVISTGRSMLWMDMNVSCLCPNNVCHNFPVILLVLSSYWRRRRRQRWWWRWSKGCHTHNAYTNWLVSNFRVVSNGLTLAYHYWIWPEARAPSHILHIVSSMLLRSNCINLKMNKTECVRMGHAAGLWVDTNIYSALLPLPVARVILFFFLRNIDKQESVNCVHCKLR